MTKERILDKLGKIKRLAESEAAIGNTEAAEAFAAALNKMLLEHEILESEIPDASGAAPQDPIIEIMVDLRAWGIDRSRVRIDWQERLAGIVAYNSMCRFLVCKGSNLIWFVGTESHAKVAEYIYGMLVPAAEKMAVSERRKHWIATGKLRGKANPTLGYREAWLAAFVDRIGERLRAMREQVVQASGSSSSMALVRINNSLVRVNEYMLTKAAKPVSSLGGNVAHNAAGAAHGRAAADRMPIERKGLTK